MAHVLARLVYRMLKYGEQYIDKGMQFYENRLQEQKLKKLQREAAALGLVLMPAKS